jgi:hypothetical protein
MQGGYIRRTAISAPHDSAQQPDITRSQMTGDWLVLLPVVLLCAIVGYRKHKTMVQKRRIHRLNRLWQLDASRN